MVDVAALASTALGTVLGYLGSKAVEVADEATKAAGAKVMEWLSSKLTGTGAQEALAKLTANPDSRGAQKMVEGALETHLEDEPSLVGELHELLEAAGVQTTVTQTMDINGDNNKGAQVAGSGNTVNIGRD